jgi:ADP-ribosyl-[dinitrogen reductase] hydrolase
MRAIRAVRPGAIETPAQERYVLKCRTVVEPLDQAFVADPVTDRALGCLLGLAVGDALGTTLEFTERDTNPPLADIAGGGPLGLQPGEWTDDTSLALCLADSLIACGELDQRDLMDRFVRWWRDGENSPSGDCLDIGTTTKRALQRYLRNGNPIAGALHRKSAGNGSIMRLAPVALRWHASPDAAVAAARAQSVITHRHPAAVEGCVLLAEILIDGIASGDKDTVLRPRRSANAAIDAVAQGSWRDKARREISSSGYVVDTLEAALWCVARSSSFGDAVLLAANLADDADTVAAVTGQIAGALCGYSVIPERWLHRLAWQSEITRRGLQLIKHKSLDVEPISGR